MHRTTIIGIFFLPVVIGALALILKKLADDGWEIMRRRGLPTWRLTISLLFVLFLIGVYIAWLVADKTSPAVEAQGYRGGCPAQMIDASKGLTSVVLSQQAACVGDSIGIWAHQSFTDEDLKNFVADKKPEEIASALKTNASFLKIIEVLRTVDPVTRAKSLDEAASAYREPWAKLRIDPKTASIEELKMGQTEAGSMAERMVARSVADLARSLLQTESP